jgi:TonB-linked SusC/RagA family outer membrane protein
MSENSINSGYWRFNFRSNVDINIGKSLLAEITVGASVEQKENPDANTTTNIFDKMALTPPNAFPVYNPNKTISSVQLYPNPLGDILNKGFYTSNARTYQTILKLTQKLDVITPGLSASGAVTFNNYMVYLSNKSRTYESFSISKNTLGDTVYTKIGQNSSLVSDESQMNLWRNFAIQGFLNYNRTFGRTLIDAMMMFNRSDYTVGTGELPYNDAGIFGRATLSNNKKYIAEFSFGYNGSEAFEEGHRWGFFPAGSLAWIISNESFLKESNAINFLKIRASYGLVGNDLIGGSRFPFYQNYSSGSSYYVGTSNTSLGTYMEGQIANADATWEKQKQMNIGLEVTFLKRIDFSLDVFNQDRYDILARPYETLPTFLGMSFPDLNEGKSNNKGFETMIRFNSDQTKDFQFFVQVDLWYAKNKIVYNSEATQLYDWLYRTGHQIGQPFVYESIGFFKDDADIAASPSQPFQRVVPGDLKYKDQNNDGIINQQDLYPLGNTTLPSTTTGLHLGLKYKGFDLDIMFQGVNGRTVYLSGSYFYAFQNNGKASEIALGRWTPTTAASATYPRLSASNNLNNFQSSSFWQRNGDFVKLRSIELGYTLPANISKKVMLSNARVFINGTNLFSWDHMDFTDPETITGYPPVKTYSFGIRVQI